MQCSIKPKIKDLKQSERIMNTITNPKIELVKKTTAAWVDLSNYNSNFTDKSKAYTKWIWENNSKLERESLESSLITLGSGIKTYIHKITICRTIFKKLRL